MWQNFINITPKKKKKNESLQLLYIYLAQYNVGSSLAGDVN